MADSLVGYGIPLPPGGGRIAAGWRPRSPGVIRSSPGPGQAPAQPTKTQRQPAPPPRADVHVVNDSTSPMQVVATAARFRKTVVLVYRKKTDAMKRRVVEVEPYSVRGPYLYAWCLQHNQIHSFLISNIVSVQQTTRKFAPRFTIEF